MATLNKDETGESVSDFWKQQSDERELAQPDAMSTAASILSTMLARSIIDGRFTSGRTALLANETNAITWLRAWQRTAPDSAKIEPWTAYYLQYGDPQWEYAATPQDHLDYAAYYMACHAHMDCLVSEFSLREWLANGKPKGPDRG